MYEVELEKKNSTHKTKRRLKTTNPFRDYWGSS